MLSLRHGTPNTPFGSASDTGSESHSHQLTVTDPAVPEENNSKRRLRSYKTTEESEFFFDFNAVKSPEIGGGHGSITSNTSSGDSTPLYGTQLSCITLLKNLIPANMAITSKTRELLQSVLSWQILPSDAPAEPSMIYGCVHLSRLIGRFWISKCLCFALIETIA